MCREKRCHTVERCATKLSVFGSAEGEDHRSQWRTRRTFPESSRSNRGIGFVNEDSVHARTVRSAQGALCELHLVGAPLGRDDHRPHLNNERGDDEQGEGSPHCVLAQKAIKEEPLFVNFCGMQNRHWNMSEQKETVEKGRVYLLGLLKPRLSCSARYSNL